MYIWSGSHHEMPWRISQCIEYGAQGTRRLRGPNRPCPELLRRRGFNKLGAEHVSNEVGERVVRQIADNESRSESLRASVEPSPFAAVDAANDISCHRIHSGRGLDNLLEGLEDRVIDRCNRRVEARWRQAGNNDIIEAVRAKAAYASVPIRLPTPELTRKDRQYLEA